MVPESRIPTDFVYEEGVSIRGRIPATISSDTPYEGIDWDSCDEHNLSADKYRFTTQTAAQFHYAKVSHILLYRKMMNTQFTSLESHRLAVLLSTYNVNRLEMWETYLEKMDAEATVANEIRDYYRRLFDENYPLVCLVALETLGVSAKVMYDHLQHIGDEAFCQINATMLKQKREELAFITKHLQDTVELSNTDRQRIITALPPYLTLLDELLSSSQELFETVNIDTTTLRDQIYRELESFYADIGLK